jgi:hypothetical protein
MKRFLILAAWCVALPSVAQPSSTMYTGQDLYDRLKNSPALANGYIAGVHDTQSGITICIPPGRVTLGQMSDMVKQTLERLPSERHMSADIFVETTLSTRWPCAKKGKSL